MAASPISPPECALLDELRLLVVVDNETDTLSSIDEGVPQGLDECAKGGFVAAFRGVD